MVVKRLFDIWCALLALLVLSPLMALAGAGIKLTSPGPILYRSRRVGRFGKIFIMYKFRSMHWNQPGQHSVITAGKDPRVFPFGRLLRQCKIDELPQLFNIIRGDMSIVGPRPEDPLIVIRNYAPDHHESLEIRPGLTSPGSLYYYTSREQSLGTGNTEQEYIDKHLPIKLALDILYLRRRSFGGDLRLIWRTVVVLGQILAGKTSFSPPPELAEAWAIVVPTRNGGREFTGAPDSEAMPDDNVVRGYAGSIHADPAPEASSG